MTITVQPATTADIEAIQALAEVIYTQQMPDTDQRARFLTRIYAPESLKRLLHADGSTVLVARAPDANHERLVGLCSYGSPLLDECEDMKSIHRLLVHPDWDLHQVGEAFMIAIEEAFDDDSAIWRISVYVPEDNMTLIRFYAAMGFHHEMPEDKDGEWYMEYHL